jgi:hypothetical protein
MLLNLYWNIQASDEIPRGHKGYKFHNNFRRWDMRMLLITSLVIFYSCVLFGQINQDHVPADTSQYQYWFNIGPGIDSYSSDFNLGLNYNFSLCGNYYQLGYQSISRISKEFYPGLEFKEFPFYACNIGIGKVSVEKYLFFANFIGPAFVWGEKVGDNVDATGIRRIKEFYSVGVALNSQIIFRPINELGVGLELYGNINPIRTLAEVRLSIHFNNGRF